MARSVLIVDDDAAFRDLASRIVTGWGHDVVGLAGTVGEGLLRAVEPRPDTALVDIGLPAGDGYDLAEQLLALPWPMQVVLVSTDSDSANVTATRRVGAIPEAATVVGLIEEAAAAVADVPSHR